MDIAYRAPAILSILYLKMLIIHFRSVLGLWNWIFVYLFFPLVPHLHMRSILWYTWLSLPPGFPVPLGHRLSGKGYIYSILIDMRLHLPFMGMSLCLLTPLRISKFPTFQSGLSSTWFLFLVLMLYRYHRNHMSLSGECRNWLSHKTYAKILRRQNW